MTTKLKFVAYDIGACGFYKWGESTSPEFGEINTTMADLKVHLTGKSVALTKMFDPEEGSGVCPVYSFALEPCSTTGDWLMVTWNEVPAHEGGVAVVSGASPVGSATVSSAAIGPNGIPGFPTYFWILPRENLVFTVCPDGTLHNGNKGFCAYIHSYIKTRSSFVRMTIDTEGNRKICGYNRLGKTEPLNRQPRFKTIKKRTPGALTFLRKNHASIRKVIGSDEISIKLPQKTGAIQSLYELIGLKNHKITTPTNKLQFEFSFTPTQDQLDQIISEAETDSTAEQSTLDSSYKELKMCFGLITLSSKRSAESTYKQQKREFFLLRY